MSAQADDLVRFVWDYTNQTARRLPEAHPVVREWVQDTLANMHFRATAGDAAMIATLISQIERRLTEDATWRRDDEALAEDLRRHVVGPSHVEAVS